MVLFERTGRGLMPTQVALSIADHARAMADNADAISRVLTGQSKQLAGAVRITAVQTVAVHLLPAILARLRAREPGIAIEVVASNAISNLLRREADITNNPLAVNPHLFINCSMRDLRAASSNGVNLLNSGAIQVG